MLKSENHLLFSWHELARKKMLQISEERKKKKSTWGRAWLQQMVWDWRGQSKRMQGCHCERERERERGVIKRELVWFVESVVCKKDSHSLGNILSFAKWIGHRERERERERLLSFFVVCTMQSLAIHYNRTRGTCYGLAQPYESVAHCPLKKIRPLYNEFYHFL